MPDNGENPYGMHDTILWRQVERGGQVCLDGLARRGNNLTVFYHHGQMFAAL